MLGDPAAPLLDVEVSLVNTSNRELLRACLRSLPEACAGLRWHATVVDNASADGSAEMLASDFPWAGVIRNSRRLGFSANHNQIVSPLVGSGSARYVLILNEDTELDPGCVRTLVELGDAHADVGIAGPAIRGTDGAGQPSWFRFPGVIEQVRATLLPGRPPEAGGSTGWLNGSCLLVRTRALAEAGSLDESFFIFYEDTDLALRFQRRGWRSLLCQKATIVHHGHQTVSQPALGSAMERQMLRSRYLYFRKHHGRVGAAAVATLVRGALLLRAAKASVVGLVGADRSEVRNGALLLRLAGYDPATVLPHERSALGAEYG